MKLKSFSEIIACINEWQAIRTDRDAVSRVLSNVESFIFIMNNYVTDNLHVYPGIYPTTGKFCIFLIAKEEDVPQSDDKLYNAIIQTTIQEFTGDVGYIPEKEAKERIANWSMYRTEWIQNQMATDVGIFKAFNLPASYMTSNDEYRSFFALEDNQASSSKFDADLITTDLPAKTIIRYYDFVRPVPPFGGGYAESSFYLLRR